MLSRACLALVVAVVVPGAAATGAARQDARRDGALALSQTALTSAEDCGRCHRDIYEYWRASAHARSADNWRFRDALSHLTDQGQRSAATLCMRCHVPAAVYAGDETWEKKATWEGVTCDFCHSVRQVRRDADRPFVLEIGGVKTGPFGDAQSIAHATAFSDVHTTATICAPCHQFVNAQGLDVLATFAEWQASDYAARGVACQRCHMRAAPGRVVDPKVARVPHAQLNLHEMPGGHSVTELNRALHALITAVRRGEQVDVTVQLTNRGAGHQLPTGSPLRSIVMEVEVDAGIGLLQRATRTYARVVADERGQSLRDEAAVWLRGRLVLRDTRLAPQERRVEHVNFAVPRHVPVRAVARFFYRYEPEPPPPGKPGLPFLSVSTWLDAASPPPKPF